MNELNKDFISTYKECVGQISNPGYERVWAFLKYDGYIDLLVDEGNGYYHLLEMNEEKKED